MYLGFGGFWSSLLLTTSCLLPLLPSCTAHHESNMAGRTVPLALSQESTPLRIGTTWQLLGPFQIGTREGSWGADPLEYLGGFRALNYDAEATFRSSLPVNGTARWSKLEAAQSITTSLSSNVSLSVGYDNVDWDFLKVVYGWAAVQYQAWARGELIVGGNETQHITLYTDAIIEFWIDDVHYFGGDAYTFRKAPPVLHLSPGKHKIDLRLWRDVRAFGGINEPTIDVLVEVRKATGTLELATPGILVSDVVDGRLASALGSVALRNSGEHDIEIVGIQPSDVRPPVSLPGQEVQIIFQDTQPLTAAQSDAAGSSNNSKITLVAGQTRPVAFNISLPEYNVSSIRYVITYRSTNGDRHLHSLNVSQPLTKLSLYSPHKVTFLHPGGMVSYAMLRSPAQNATCKAGQSSRLPVLIANHGAGLEASNPMVAHALDPVSDLCAWVVFPTGVTPWSGDDWHNWGFADVEAAVQSIPSWIKSVGWSGPSVDVNRWIMTGHSNGGQGTWYALTHRPDRLVAAAPLSGYSSIQKYVPYELWQPTDPRRTAIVSASLNSYRHEMLVENIKGIPVLQQHGEIDDNVPTYNSRFLSQQLFQAGTASNFNEVAGQNHWWDTVMTTEPLVKFFREQTASNVTIPRKLDDFSIVVGDPGDTGSKGGIRVTHLDDPGQYGRVQIKGHAISTSNVLSLELDADVLQLDSILINGERLELRGGLNPVTRSADGSWTAGALEDSKNDNLYRHGRQLGAMTAILRTRGPFIIRHTNELSTIHIALQVSRNFHQYVYADAAVTSAGSEIGGLTGNIISIAVGDTLPAGLLSKFSIEVGTHGVFVRDSQGRDRIYTTNGTGIGAIFLRPLADERLELVVWGSNAAALAQAARLVPMMTGVGQPDFVILGGSARWRGVEGALALGYFDHRWEVSPSSVVS